MMQSANNHIYGAPDSRFKLFHELMAKKVERILLVASTYDAGTMDMDTDFFKIEKGSLGGKARGLAFVSSLLNREATIREKYPQLCMSIPKSLVITTEGFDDFIEANDLKPISKATNALGNTQNEEIADIVYVKPDSFDVACTQQVAQEISRFNARLQKANRKYLLIGPGRWGSADRWLGIPVRWCDISAVGAIVETAFAQLKAEPSQGSHFFHNITSLGISYIHIMVNDEDFFHWGMISGLPPATDNRFTAHVRLERPLTLKVDGRKSMAMVSLGSLR